MPPLDKPWVIMKNAILDIFRRRFACHAFMPDRAVAREDLDVILEAGRLSPSSFGLEQWKFVVVSKLEAKQALQAASFNQPQVGNAGVVVVILAKIAELDPDSDYIQKLMAREYPGEAMAPALANYRGFHANTDIKAWSITQCHIAAANMMTAATAVGLDSCAIGGFLPDQVKHILGIDGDRYEIALILPFGYCAEAAHEKQRLPLSELVEYR
jgi:nitroreductase